MSLPESLDNKASRDRELDSQNEVPTKVELPALLSQACGPEGRSRDAKGKGKLISRQNVLDALRATEPVKEKGSQAHGSEGESRDAKEKDKK